MDKRIIFSVAGSGKTSHIIDRIGAEDKALILTYTENNLLNLQHKTLEKFGYLPDGVKIQSYFHFLYSFCYRPFLADRVKSKGINWDTPPSFTRNLNRSKPEFYLDTHRRLYHNRIAKLLDQCKVVTDAINRLEKYFDTVYVDEVQDLGGHDFNFLKAICTADVSMLLVGDFFQHTFDTSRDGSVNRNLHANYDSYRNRFEQEGVQVDLTSLNKSYRCDSAICGFISGQLGIEIESHRTDNAQVKLIQDQESADELYHNKKIVKLFYQEHHKYVCFSENWGSSKGMDCYENVCIVLNQGSYKKLQEGKLAELNPQTRNKLYVACTRARGDLFLVPDKYYKAYKQTH
jgi:hypothetical protein